MVIMKKANFWIALIIFVFGVLTLVSGGRALLTEGGLDPRRNAIPLILWFNFVSGFFYVLTSYLTFALNSCAKKVSLVLAGFNALALLYLVGHIFQGGLFENRTLAAMSFRAIFWIALVTYFQRSALFIKKDCSC